VRLSSSVYFTGHRGTARIIVEPGVLKDGLSRKVSLITSGGAFRYTTTGPTPVQTGDNVTSGIQVDTSADNFLKQPFKVTPSLSLRVYLDYSFNGNRVNTGSQLRHQTSVAIDHPEAGLFTNLVFSGYIKVILLTVNPPFTQLSKEFRLVVSTSQGSPLKNTGIVPTRKPGKIRKQTLSSGRF